MKKFRLILAVLGLSSMLAFVPIVAAAADSVSPDDVENVMATAGDASVTLSWMAATDDVAVTGYKVYYGTEHVDGVSEASYTSDIDAKNVTTLKVDKLTNGTMYYFVVTAYDAAGNESENYSNEATAKPVAVGAATADAKSPTVTKAEALNQEIVKVTFSEGVKLPAKNPQEAFTVQNNKTLEVLEVMAVAIDTTDASGKTVLLTTQKQTKGTEYILTAGADIEDTSGNGVVSGTSDTALFTGSDIEKAVSDGSQPAAPESGEDKTAPAIQEVVVKSDKSVEVVFTEPVKLSIDPAENFSIVSTADVTSQLQILGIDVNESGNVVTITTETQKGISYTLMVSGVVDLKGNAVATDTKTAFTGGGETLGDLIPPEDVTGLIAKILSQRGSVRLHWTPSVNTAGDLADQLLYRSDDGGKTYGTGKSLGKTLNNTMVNSLKAGAEYYFKITSKDTAGNENKGTVVAVKLPETGMGVGLFGLISLAAGSLFGKKKKV